MIGQGHSVHERAVRRNDVGAFLALLLGLFFVLRGQSLEMTKETGPAMYTLSAFGFVVAVVLPLLVHAMLERAPPGRDEYLRKLAGLSAAAGFYFAFAVFAIWAPLTGTLLPDLRGPQVLGLMLLGASLCWFWMRWRDSRR